MIKSAILSIIFSGTLLSAHSQTTVGQTTIGIRGGYLVSNQYISNAEEGSVRAYASWWGGSSSRYIGGFSVGLYMSRVLSEKLRLNTGLSLAQKGQEEYLDGGNAGGDGIYRDRINYFMAPIEINFIMKPESDISFFWDVGLYAACGISGSTSFTQTEHRSSFWGNTPGTYDEGRLYFEPEISSREAYDPEDLIVKPWDFGCILGFGIYVGRLPISLTYQMGLVNTHPDIVQVRSRSNDEISNERVKRNQSISFTIQAPIVSGF